MTEDALLANSGTFLGALCFLVAALLVLPRREQRGAGRWGMSTEPSLTAHGG